MAGLVSGLAAGLLLALVWLYGDWDVALALTVVFGGLVAVLFASGPGWRPFMTGLVASAVFVVALLLGLAWSAAHL